MIIGFDGFHGPDDRDSLPERAPVYDDPELQAAIDQVNAHDAARTASAKMLAEQKIAFQKSMDGIER